MRGYLVTLFKDVFDAFDVFWAVDTAISIRK